MADETNESYFSGRDGPGKERPSNSSSRPAWFKENPNSVPGSWETQLGPSVQLVFDARSYVFSATRFGGFKEAGYRLWDYMFLQLDDDQRKLYLDTVAELGSDYPG